MYLGYQGDKIKFYTEEELNPVLYSIDKSEYTDDEYVLEGDEYVPKDAEWEERERQREHARIQELYMTRSDFFDGTIRAFGMGESELLVCINAVLNALQISEIEKKISINNFENALNFYRKHPLFTLLSGNPIPITPDGSDYIIITSAQWDRFFDETNKRNPDAYKALITEPEPTEEPTVEPEPTEEPTVEPEPTEEVEPTEEPTPEEG